MKNYRICYIIDFIVYVSSHFLRSIFHCSCFISFSSVHNSFSYFIFIPFSPQSISSNLIKIDIHYLKLNSGGFTSPCLFILNKKYSRKNPSHGTVKSLKFIFQISHNDSRTNTPGCRQVMKKSRWKTETNDVLNE